MWVGRGPLTCIILAIIIFPALGPAGYAVPEQFNMFPADSSGAALSAPPNLNEAAELIVRGIVTKVSSQFINNTMWSTAEVSVNTVEKGNAVSKVVVEYEGGKVGDTELLVSNQPRFREGERVLLYLVQGTGGNYKVAGGPAGKILLDPSGNVLATAGSGYIYTGYHWPSGNVGYYVNAAGGPPAALSAVQAGFQAWNDAGAAFSFAYGAGGNTVRWAYVDGPGNTLAVTYVWLSSYVVYSCETVFDTAESWATDGSTGKFDVQNVAAHEAGHWLVLGDLYVPEYSEMTMYGYASRGETKKRTLGWGDISGIQFIYPSNNPPPPSPSYPSDRWERLWCMYSGTPSNPWSQFLGSGPDESNLVFDNNWGSGILAYGRSDRIGFISSRTVDMASGKWTFTLVSDDGVRLYIDDQLVVDEWKVQPPTAYTYARTFDSAGAHRLRLEYFENEYGAKLSFSMQVEAPPPSPSHPSDRWERLWYAYSGGSLSQFLGSGPDESNLTFDTNWASGTLAYGRADYVGFVSSRTANIASGTWTFTVVSDDGVRLYIDDQLVIDAWKVQPPTTYTYTQTFASTADHRLRLEYFEKEGGAKLSFSMQGVVPPPTPSYPSDHWERLWYTYSSGSLSQFLGSGPDESSLNFDNSWSSGVLAYGRADYVGFISSRTVDMASGKWTFTVVSDDGVRLYIDDQLVIDAWKVQPPTTYTYSQTLPSAGAHQLRLEYSENEYGAKLSFNMQVEAPPPSYPSDKWERLWYVYSGSPSSPWGQYLGSGPDEPNPTFDKDWGSGIIAYSRSDRVGFISSRTVNLAAGTWIFTVTSDDGVRLYVDDQLIIDGWKVQPPTTYTYTQTFASTADRRLRLEWFENEYGARVAFDMQQAGAEVGLKGEYYSSSGPGEFTTKITERTDSTVNFDWGNGSPAPGVPADLFAVRWTGSLNAPASGTYTIYVTADDGVRVWIDGNLVVDAWRVQPPTEYSWTGLLSAGKHSIKIEYYENYYGAVIKLGWTMPGGSKTYPIPSSYLSPT
jgi:hypothetical protein